MLSYSLTELDYRDGYRGGVEHIGEVVPARLFSLRFFTLLKEGCDSLLINSCLSLSILSLPLGLQNR